MTRRDLLDELPDVRDGLNRAERIVLTTLAALAGCHRRGAPWSSLTWGPPALPS